MTTLRYFTDDELNRLRTAMLTLGAEQATGFEILDGYMHMRECLYAIEEAINRLDKPRSLEDQVADEMVMAMTDEMGMAMTCRGKDGLGAIDNDLILAFAKRFRRHIRPMLTDIADMARAGAEMNDWEAVLAGEGQDGRE